MTESSPWEPIAIPGSDFNVRQVVNQTAVPCYWARDPQGACLFVVELRGDHTREFQKEQPQVHGVDVDLRATSPGTQRLVLTLEEQVNLDLFTGMCQTLATALERASDSGTSLAIAVKHIRRWKAFLAGKAAQRLSPEEIRGLFAELCFLEEILSRGGSQVKAMAAWLGPERSQQDFIYGDTAVEIKSLAGTERSSVRISSEDQLESLQGSLYLRIYRLSELPESPAARNLNEQVESIETRLTESDAIEDWGRKLAGHRYAPIPDYDRPKFIANNIRTFNVKGQFPRIVRSGLPVGVSKVGYQINLEAIAPFECDGKAVFAGL